MEQKRDNDETIEKYDFKLKSKPKDGVILQLHHTVRGPNGECQRIRFSAASFDDSKEKLACSDNGGNIFILDFLDLKFWKVPSIGICSALHFVPDNTELLVIAKAKIYDICFLDIENGTILRSLTGHTAPIKNISFSNNKFCNLLTASTVEAIIWELNNYTKFFTLNTFLGAQIQQILYTPAGDYLVACFQNDTIQIWKHESMKSVKQIIPSELKHMKCIAFTMNGRAMAMAGLSPTLILFSMDTWKALKSLNLTKYKITGAQQIAFIPQVFDGGSNKILAILSSDCILHLLDLESTTLIHSLSPESSGIRKFIVSQTGKYFSCILQMGEVNIYNTLYVIDMARKTLCKPEPQDVPSTSTHRCVLHERPSSSKTKVEQKMRICMDSARLRRILMQYGEYPDKFRSIIWRSLLDTPRNKSAYAALVDKGIHSTYKDIERQFTIHSTVTLNNLKRLLSCLAHWCPLFSVMKFLPGFTFPFVKVLQKDPLLLFECVATVLINYCQLWFEFAPFPPLSILAMIENILAEHDQQLLDHFCTIGVTSQTYALKILETAFSEVLTCSEWLILWDHILSNEPAFILMAVVSYNIIQRNVIRKLKTYEHLDSFYHMQNPINKKSFLKKAYVLLNETSEDIHPRKFFKKFTSLEKGDCYQQFTGYPKATICMKLAKKERRIKTENKHSLKDLTTSSQAKIIKERSRKNNSGVSDDRSVVSDNSIEEIYPIKQDSQKKHSVLKTHHSHCKGDSCNKYENQKVIKTVHHRHKAYSDSKSSQGNTCKHLTFNSRKKSLEKEVKKLMKSYTNSEQSDT